MFVFFSIENDCGDSSDEQNCHGTSITMLNQNQLLSFFLVERTCDPLTQFSCPHTSGRCIPNCK